MKRASTQFLIAVLLLGLCGVAFSAPRRHCSTLVLGYASEKQISYSPSPMNYITRRPRPKTRLRHASVQSGSNVRKFGARGDTRILNDGAITAGSVSFSSAQANFAQSDVSKNIMIRGAGVSGAPLSTTIIGCRDPNTIVVADKAATTVSGAIFSYGTDDTKAIQNAIDSLGASGGSVYLPPGVYGISNNLLIRNSNITLSGARARTTVLTGLAFWNTSLPGNIPAMINMVSRRATPDMERISNLVITGLTFVGFDYAKDGREPKCISSRYADHVLIEDNDFRDFGNECIWPTGGGIPSAVEDSWRIRNNRFYNIGVRGAPSAITINGTHFTVTGNYFESARVAVGVSNDSAIVSGNIVINPVYFGLGLGEFNGKGSNSMIIGNTVELTASPSGLRAGLGINAKTGNSIVSENRIIVRSVPGAKTAYGIMINGASNGTVIRDNTIRLYGANGGGVLVGIFGGTDGLDVALDHNVIELLQPNSSYTAGVQVAVGKSTDSLKAEVSNNTVRGFARPAFAFDISDVPKGSLSFAAINNVADGGQHRYGQRSIADSSLDNVPVTFSSPDRRISPSSGNVASRLPVGTRRFSTAASVTFRQAAGISSAVEATVNVPGVSPGDVIVVRPPYEPSDNQLLTGFVSAPGVVTLRWAQIGGGRPNPPDVRYQITALTKSSTSYR